MKKIGTGILGALAFALLTPFAALAGGESTVVIDGVTWSYRMSNGAAILVKASHCEGEVRVPTHVGMLPVREIDSCCFSGNAVTSVVMSVGITNIASSAFSDCDNLESVTFPEGLTGLPQGLFAGITSLKTLYLPSTLADLAMGSLEGPTWIVSESISVASDNPNFCTKDGLLMSRSGQTLYRALNKETVEIPEGTVYVADNAFFLCDKIRTIHVPDGCYILDSMRFGKCSSLEAFSGNSYYPIVNGMVCHQSMDCFPDERYDLSHGVNGDVVIPSCVYRISSFAFPSLDGLRSVTVLPGVEIISRNAFSDCSELTSVMIPSSVTKIEDWAFGGCDKLKTVYVPRGATETVRGLYDWDTDVEFVERNVAGIRFDARGGSVSSDEIAVDVFKEIGDVLPIPVRGGYEFLGWYYGSTKVTPDWTPDRADSMYTFEAHWAEVGGGVVWEYRLDKGQATLTKAKACSGDVTVPTQVDATYPVRAIGYRCFEGCTELTSVVVPAGVSIGVEAFKDCTSLVSVTLSDGVTEIEDRAFENCTALTFLRIPEGITSLGRSLHGCRELRVLELPSTLTSLGDLANGQPWLVSESIRVDSRNPNFSSKDGFLMSRSGKTLYRALNKENVVIPEGTDAIDLHAFRGCDRIRTVVVPGECDLKYCDFSGCNRLESFTGLGSPNFSFNGLLCNPWSEGIWNGKDYEVVQGVNGDVVIPSCVKSIHENAFDGRKGLKTVTMAPGIKIIEYAAFIGCSGLTSVMIPTTVTEIGDLAFANCDALKTVYVSVGDKERVKGLYDWYRWADDIEFVERDVAGIRFDAQGGTVSPDEIVVANDRAIGDVLPVPVRMGYEFLGWHCGSTKVTEEWSPTLSGNVYTFTAHWKDVGGDVPEDAVAFALPEELTTGETAVNASVRVSDSLTRPTVKMTGLPTGLKFTAKDILKKGSKTEVDVPANTIYGTPTKSGVYTVVATVTVSGKKIASASQTVVVRKAAEYVLKAELPDVGVDVPGKVTGAGVYAPNRSVTLRATANKGYVFSGWYRGDVLVSRLVPYVFLMPAEDVTYFAKFVTADEDKASIELSVGGIRLGSARGDTSSTETNLVCGVAARWPVAASALSATTVKVSGLPTGLKFTAKDIMKKGSKTEVDIPANTIYGAPTAASKTDKYGNVTPSKVKVTVTTAGKSKAEYAIALTVEPLPDWAVGTFDGAATMTVSAAGKVSGKAGKTAFSATCFRTYEDGVFTADTTYKVGKTVCTNTITVFAVGELGRIVADGTQPIAFELVQNPWLRKDLKDIVPSVQTKPAVTCALGGDFAGVTLTLKAKGAVQAAGKLADGRKFSAKAQLLLVDDGWMEDGEANALVYLDGQPVQLRLTIEGGVIVCVDATAS